MDLLYSDFCFRRYFNFIEKKRVFHFVDIMQDKAERLFQILDSLKVNSNEVQITCCVNELADLLGEVTTEEVQLLENGDSYLIVLEVMENNLTNRDILYYGIFALYRLMEESVLIKRNLVSLNIHNFVIELMEDYQNEAVIQQIACRILILIVEDANVRLNLDTESTVQLIVQAMKNFEQDDELQLPALQALTKLMQEDVVNDSYKKSFVDQKFHLLVLDILEEHQESGEVVEEAFLLFSVLAKLSCICEQLLQCEIASVVLNGMEYHINASGVQYAGLQLLKWLAGNTELYQDTLVHKNIGNTLLKIMELDNHMRSNVIQKKGLEVFFLICNRLLQLSDDKKEVTHHWLQHLLVTMVTHCDDTATLIVACNVFCKLGQHHPTMLMLVDNDHCNAIMAALVLHKDNAEICQVTCKTIVCIVEQSIALQQSFFDKGVYIHIIQAMQMHHVAGVQQYGCQCLRMLCMSEVKNMELISEYGAWDVITKCLTDFEEEVSVQQEAIAIIALLLTDLESLRPKCLTERSYISVLDAMRKFTDDAELIEISFEAIGVFTAREELADSMVRAGVVMTFLNAMDTHSDVVTIQQKGCILIQVFSSYIKGEECIASVKSIIKAMQHFAQDDGVQKESCVALRLIAQVDVNNSVTLVNQCVHERLFAILNQFSEDRKMIELASDVLWLLGCQRNYSSLMLLSACASGLIKGAHCLVQVGADVNGGEGTNTPLCAACKNNKEEMVRYLLTQGITDVHTALNLCLEMEHHNIVGILLQKLGHDREAGVISWNGLNLGSLYPEWLYPALSGSAFGLAVETERWCNYVRSAENAFIKRFKVLEKLLDVTLIKNILDRNHIISTVVADASDDSDEEEEEQTFLSSSSDEGLSESKILTEEAPLRARSISGASLPYSSYDPRVVVALTVGDPILLPKRKSVSSTVTRPSIKISPPSRQSSTEFSSSSPLNRRRSKSMLDINSLLTTASKAKHDNEDSSTSRPGSRRRTASDVNKNAPLKTTPLFELPGIAFMYDSTPRRRSRTKSADSSAYDKQGEEEEEENIQRERKISARMQNRRRTVYTAFPSANGASVRVIDVSGNRITDLSRLEQAGDYFSVRLAKVQKLELSNNQLSSLPTALCEAMPLLEHINLSRNMFEEFPFCLQHCKRLKVLDLSHNKLQLPTPSTPCSSVVLEYLSLANNSLREFPEWLADFFPGIIKLSLSGNEIEKLPSTNLKMPRLKILDLSHNKIDKIPDPFLVECRYLENLNASCNELSTLPTISTNSYANLRTLRLAHNNLAQKEPFFLPSFVLMLPNLKALDLSHNKLTHLPPPCKWASKQLKELVLAHNNIKRIQLDSDISNWKNLERLIISHNALRNIPKEIGLLSSLTTLDLSHNPGISSLPDEMGRLSNLWDLQLTGIKLDLEESLLGNTKNIIAFLNSKLMNSVPYYRMKLVTVGLAGRGKTTLLNQLLKSKAPPSQNELVIRDWIVRDTKATCRQCHHRSVIYTISTWDFKGKEEFYHVYQGLMSSRTLYLVVYDVLKGGQELEELRPWLQNIHACAPDVPLMLVGTHLDKIPKERYDQILEEMKIRARDLFLSPGLPEIKAHVVLNCTQESPGIQTLRNKIVDLVYKCKCKGHPILGSSVPQKFVRLQDLILREVEGLGSRIPVLRLNDVKKLWKVDGEEVINEEELGQAVKFLHEAGILVHYDDPVAHLSDLFFVQPEWLCHVISSVVSVRSPNGQKSTGIIKKQELDTWVKDEKSTVRLPQDLLPQFLRLLERFGVLLPISNSEFLMPSRLQPRPASVDLPDLTQLDTYYRRLYQLAYVPLGFWARLITRLLLFLPEIRPKEDERKTCYMSPDIDYWCDGIQVKWSTHSFSVFQDSSAQFGPHVLAIVVPLSDIGACLLGTLVDHVDTLIEEWFSDLCCLDPIRGLPLVNRLCPCIKCDKENAHAFTIEDCVEQALRFEDIACPKTSELLPIERVAPDVALTDLKHKGLVVDKNELVLEQKRENVLGDGGYGTVYIAKYMDKMVAVKIFHTEGDVNPHRSFRQEVPFLAQLNHPSIISLVGVSVRPRAIVLERAPLGSLSSLLSKGEVLSRSLQHRIALQIAEGLAYLHHNKVVYRDLKPHNVLIFSLSLSIVINAKITDFGIARYATLYGLKSAEGTPGYRAPEVARGDVGYNKKADMYSFGMLLYELVTGGKRPFEDLRFRNELDAAVMQGRMMDPITDYGCSPWPDVDDLIQHLLEPRADMRPTADQVFERLSKAELLCLKRDIPVFKEQTVECMAVRNYTEDNEEKIELWVGSGLCESNSGIVSWVNLTDRGSEGCQGTVIKDTRAKCMTAVRSDYVLVGTQSGNIWVFDACKHECINTLPPLTDSVVALRHYFDIRCQQDIVIAGLADGKLVIYQTKDLKNSQASRQVIQLCKKIEEGGQCTEDCTGHSIACLTIAQKSVYCGCGNDIVVLKIDEKIKFKRRWSIEDRRRGLVRNIAVAGSLIWTSTKDSPIIDYWDASEPILRGSINCKPILTESGFKAHTRDIRVVCMMLHGHTLWVGLGTGHIILLSQTSRETLCVLHRHTASVRCMAMAGRGNSFGRPISLIVTGGMGFVQRPGCNQKKTKGEFGHVLVWEADIGEHVKRLITAHLKRHQETRR